MKLIEQAWDLYRERVIPPQAGEVQVDESRKAFYAGATALFTSIMAGLGSGDEATVEDLSLLDGVRDELDEYVAGIMRDNAGVPS